MNQATDGTAATSEVRRYCILGTAGHIDHGKSALVKALTGTDPDRLPEEQARGMTIELGFAHFVAPHPQGGEVRVGIVDVPGHERFVRTMVAGATGVDLGMLVVAADDGVMPQTREHVEILHLLGVQTGVVVISKMDLVHSDRIEAVTRQVADLVVGTSLEDWSVVAASAKTRAGLDRVAATVGRLAAGLPVRHAGEIFRLAIDRVFAVHGRGTVVTGSALAGRATAGVVLELRPPGLACKVREVQSYGLAVDAVGAGQRAALNLTGIDRERIDRGMELATPGYLTGARYLDARVRLLGRRDRPFPSHQRVRVCLGTTEAIAMLVVVGSEVIPPGGEALVQLRFAQPVVASHGQRFIIRNETAQATLGGGRVIRPISRRFRAGLAEEVDALRRAESGDVFVRYGEAVRQAGFEPRTATRLACEIGAEPAAVAALARRLEAEQAVLLLAGRAVHRDTVEALQRRALRYLLRHHRLNPAEPGLPRDRFVGWVEKRSAPGCGRVVTARLEESGWIAARGPYVAHREFRPALSPEDAALLARALTEIESAGFDPPPLTSLKATAGLSRQRLKVLDDLLRCELRVVPFAPQQYASATALEQLKEIVRGLGSGRAFKLAEVRDALKLSRRVVQPMLEYLDRIQFTRRVGDERVLQ